MDTLESDEDLADEGALLAEESEDDDSMSVVGELSQRDSNVTNLLKG